MQTFFTERRLTPRPFQLQAIESITAGSNLLLVAGTAQGKTESVVVPVAARILESERSVACCYLAPTRALLNDLHARVELPLAQLGLRAVVRHGDRHLDAEDALVDVLLTTPESLDVMLIQHSAVLPRVRIVVVDEVHQMYGTPRGAQVVSLLERLKWAISAAKDKPLQRIALSATVGDPNSVAAWMAGSDLPLQIVSSGVGREIDAFAHWCSTDIAAANWIAQTGHRKMLVFVNSRRHCEEVSSALTDTSGAEILVHYSDLGVSDREYVEERFRRADRAICVATGTLELGIDIGSIDAVAMLDPAFSVQAFLQRIGRAARTQTSVPVYLPIRSEIDLVHQLALLSLARQAVIEDEQYPEWYSVLAQQVLSIVASNDRRRIYEKLPSEIYGCWPWFDGEAARQLLDGLSAAGFLEREERIHSFRQGRNLALMLDSWGVSTNIAGTAAGVPLLHGRNCIGAIQTSPNLATGDVLRYSGRYWRIVAHSATGIAVVPCAPVQGAVIPNWLGGRGSGLSNLVAQEMQTLLVGLGHPQLSMTAETLASWERVRARAAGLPVGPDAVWESVTGTAATYYTFAGHLENEMLRLLLDQQGQPVSLAKGRTLGGIALVSTGRLTFSGATIEAIRHAQDDHWRGLRRWTHSGPMFDHIPTSLRRREVLAQLTNSAFLERTQQPRAVVSSPGFTLA
jgi:ATP-dependent Lhr-like helicase